MKANRTLPVISRAAIAIVVAAATLASGVAGAAPALPSPLPIAFVYLGNPGDAGWTYAHDVGAGDVQAKFGDKVKITRVENVPESADAERVIRDLANKGNKIIIGTSFGFQDFGLKVARSFPDTVFLQSGYKLAKNYGAFDVRMYQGAYLAGVLAGAKTKTNTLGFVASIPIPEVVRNINAYTLGARSVNPKVQTKVVWINSWYNPGKEKQAAETLIGQGADVLLQNTDSTTVLQTAQEKGVFGFGWDSDMQKFAPKAHLASVVIKWGVYYNAAVQQVMDGTWKSEHVWWGLPEKAIAIEKVNGEALPAGTTKSFEQQRQKIVDGWSPFTGPIKDQSGATKVAAGVVLKDSDLVPMNWFVEGVQGSLPK
ncbi:BMP family ABC transporter substrate-binding protein [Herbaspirillum sp. alder98]|uniref:BMP family ABC transporter substrate-binding protein n=1 Tax=Herbaspirillum sp. alder98 TaxID=2913096 RepID=UPI001CD8D135|nr:BMP family ABC transporter substrate-binding protein [Herbaspirillum sp. alder98]MCA1325618.1 BMP family ABC transporter substrate-binding protein [Herbaspirillum sp. alder98]